MNEVQQKIVTYKTSALSWRSDAMKKFEEDRRIQAESGWIVQSSQIIAAAAGRINKVIVTYRK